MTIGLKRDGGGGGDEEEKTTVRSVPDGSDNKSKFVQDLYSDREELKRGNLILLSGQGIHN